MNNLQDKKIAFLVTDGFEQVELVKVREALENEGAKTSIISPKNDSVRAWDKDDWGNSFDVDIHISQASSDEYDALVLPGGVMNPDHLRMDEASIAFIQNFFEDGKPVSAICHGPWSLIDAGVVLGRTMTSYPSLRKDLENAGAIWVDKEVVVDNGLVTSRRPSDLDAFNAKTVEEIKEGKHVLQHA